MNQPIDKRDTEDQSLGFAKSMRLRSQSDYDRVYESEYYAADQTLVVKAVFNRSGATRLGLSINRRVGGAVVRNDWKRKIREAFRLQRLQLPAGLDLVVRPRRGARCDYQRIYKSLPRLAHRLSQQIQKGNRDETG